MMKYLPVFLSCFIIIQSVIVFAEDQLSGLSQQQEVIKGSLIVSNGGSVTITADDKIILKPGTKVTAGGTLRVTITSKDIKSIKKKSKERPLEVTKEEQEAVNEHTRLETAFYLFKPFPGSLQGIYSGEKERESFTLQDSNKYGIFPEQQRRIADSHGIIYQGTINHFTSNIPICQLATAFHPVAVMALRL
jgi:hypothetical protein